MSPFTEILTDNLTDILIDKIKLRKASLGVIGLGYVGLPLAVEKAKAGYRVFGFDIQQKRVDMVNQGINYIGDVVENELRELVQTGMITATTDYSFIRDLDVISICVPTPLDSYQQPDITYVKASAEAVAAHMHPGMLVVLESTTYPGTTEEIVLPILEETGLKCGVDFYLAYSPERVDPGNRVYNTKNTPKVVGGITKDCTQVAAMLYEQVLEGKVHQVSSPAVAEMEKILENTFRNINIALVNEMAILCNRMGIDIWEVIDAASTKPYGFMPFYPGPGLGGHCIPVDPWYLTWKAREFNYHTRLIEVAGEINNSMPEFVVERIGGILNQFCKPINGSTVYLLGIAYKKDIDDYRESPVIKIIEILKQKGAHVVFSDPKIPHFSYKGTDYEGIEVSEENLRSADIVVLTTDHSDYDYKLIGEYAEVLFDTRNAMQAIEHKNHYFRL
ncbi:MULTISPECIES: nucleotide sugar dehydrogenase [Brevibacillus]|uniref:nucleotide sugar dehydrogenase n=1 Tax=Brevibacillus TaxID=55080 RepID=UPI000D0EA493|nr:MULTISPECIES: nucleotide sugar dehydrogenase [Brevibacillus]PSJ67294.1 UDP-N-acetyl-D-glucosamine dehydrogenase [Brevibacillus brevis]RED21636.1 UDP-N-acetyl-D-glucosamine dehydrogenase [Brevibacillus brevis]TQK63088.1 UDP-N-acetyl-D-glucosamine dehydrogenase [Brevibacillus sp. AG162]VEF86692.1 UDP-glucose 6-dehydrogenase tuaD [Brevibacillus brevis]GEC91885.1 UDP-N-acetyl-D-glucosamine dehydrogenase [Brevibacillus brevis]